MYTTRSPPPPSYQTREGRSKYVVRHREDCTTPPWTCWKSGKLQDLMHLRMSPRMKYVLCLQRLRTMYAPYIVHHSDTEQARTEYFVQFPTHHCLRFSRQVLLAIKFGPARLRPYVGQILISYPRIYGSISGERTWTKFCSHYYVQCISAARGPSFAVNDSE